MLAPRRSFVDSAFRPNNVLPPLIPPPTVMRRNIVRGPPEHHDMEKCVCMAFGSMDKYPQKLANFPPLKG